MRGRDGKLCFIEKERGKVWKDYMENIKNEENDAKNECTYKSNQTCLWCPTTNTITIHPPNQPKYKTIQIYAQKIKQLYQATIYM